MGVPLSHSCTLDDEVRIGWLKLDGSCEWADSCASSRAGFVCCTVALVRIGSSL